MIPQRTGEIRKTLLLCCPIALALASGLASSAPIHDAARDGDAERVKTLLTSDPKLIEARTEDGNTPLHLAALEGHAAVARVLLEHGAQVNARGLRQETPLHMAMYYGHREVAELLLDKRAEPNLQSATGETPLHVAARKGQRDLVELLLEHDAGTFVRDKSGKTPAALAAENGHSELAQMLTPRVGELNEVKHIAIGGAKTFSAESLLNGVRATPDFLEISDPFAPLDAFVEALQRKLQLGYQHHGFPRAMISARLHTQPARIVLTVDEGPRYFCAGVSISGLTNMPARAILERLTLTNAPAPAPRSILQFNDTPPSSAPSGQSGSSRSEQSEALWAKADPARFSDFDLHQIKEQIADTMRNHGFLFPRIETTAVPDPTSHTAELRVDVLEEGPRAVVGSIEFSGNRKNSRDALLRYLDLKPGMELTSQTISNIEERMWRSARFLSNSVFTGSPDASERVPLRIEVAEYDPAPQVDEPFSRADQAMLKMREWLSKLGEGRDEAVLTWSGVPKPSSHYELILSPQGGLAVLAGDTSPDSPSKALEGAVLKPTLAVFCSQARAAKLTIPHLSEGLLLSAAVGSKAAETNETPFDITIGAGYTPPQEDSEQHFRIALAVPPVACIGLNHRLKSTNWFEGNELIRSNADMLLRVDSRTGQIIGLRVTNQQNHAALQLRFERGAFDRSVRRLEEAGAALPNRYDSNAPFSTLIGFLAQELLSSDLLKTVLRSNLPGATWNRLPALLAHFDFQELLSPLNQLRDQSAATNAEEAFVVPEAFASQEAANSSVIAMVAGWFVERSDQLVLGGSWPNILAREAGLVFQGRAKYAELALEGIYDSPETGPIGYLTTATLLARAQPPLARRFAARGLERLSAADFRRDWELFLEGDTVISQCLAKLAAALARLDPQDIEALAILQSPARAQLIRQLVRGLRSAKDQPLMKTLAPALDDFWEHELKVEVAGALKELSVDAAAAYDQALKFYQGQLPDYARAIELFQQSAERGHEGAQFFLGQIYENGQGVPKDFTAALHWYRQAATNGSPAAAMALANIYSDGLQVTPDRVEVFVWYSVAAAQQGQSVAEALSKGAQRRLTPEQTEEGTKRIAAILAARLSSHSSAEPVPINKE